MQILLWHKVHFSTFIACSQGKSFSETNHYLGKKRGELSISEQTCGFVHCLSQLRTASLCPGFRPINSSTLAPKETSVHNGCRLGKTTRWDPHTCEIYGEVWWLLLPVISLFPTCSDLGLKLLFSLIALAPTFSILLWFLPLFCLWSSSVLVSSLQLLNLSC